LAALILFFTQALDQGEHSVAKTRQDFYIPYADLSANEREINIELESNIARRK
jgi:hypothetical protein